MTAATLKDRRGAWAFAAGCLMVTIGVVLHLPMFWMGRDLGFRLDGMPMDDGMLTGMGLIVAGIGVAAYGLLPSAIGPQIRTASRIAVHAPEDAPLSPAHWSLMAVLVIALVIDVMKPAALGFVMPGMTRPRSQVSLSLLTCRRLASVRHSRPAQSPLRCAAGVWHAAIPDASAE